MYIVLGVRNIPFPYLYYLAERGRISGQRVDSPHRLFDGV